MHTEQNEIQILQEIKSIAYFIGNTTDISSIKLKLADFHYRAKNLHNSIFLNISKKPIIEKFSNSHFNLDEEEYLAGSRISAIKKAKEVLRIVEEKNIDLSNYGFLSLGGGDGTELFVEIENSKSNYGILMEYDFYSVKKFSNNQIPFYLKNYNRDIEIEVIECDLLDKKKFDVAKKLITDKKLDGIVVTIHAVLHELSTRSNFMVDMETLFKRIYDLHSNILLIIREPGISENWKEEDFIFITIKEEHRKKFYEILNRMNEIHFNNSSTNLELFETGEIKCKSDLAIESLTKLFYSEDFSYEKDEKITSISMNIITNALKASKFKDIEPEHFFTDSMKKNINHFGVKFKGSGEKILSKPQCFTYTIARKIT